MVKVLIGLPVYQREWILPKWFEYIERQTMPLSDIGFIFELGTNDEPTHNVLWEWQTRHPEVAVFDGLIRDDTVHEAHPPNGRSWNGDKYWRMVDYRNSLLDRAIMIQPDRYFSLDSDILLEDPHTLDTLYELTEDLDAVSPLSYMHPNTTQFPSVMTWTHEVGGKARRVLEYYHLSTLFQADVIMAAVMMSKPVYETVRYRWHSQGEDLGWSADATVKGFKLYCASGIYGAHIMEREHLPIYLERGDPRSTNILKQSM